MRLRVPTKVKSSDKAQVASQTRFQCVRILILFTATITFMPQLGSVEIKAPYFHFRLNYDRLLRDELESRLSFELTDLLPDTFCLSTIFAEEQAHFLEGCINRVFKGKNLKRNLTEICSVVDATDEVRISLSGDLLKVGQLIPNQG
jgi:hypothetical protein